MDGEGAVGIGEREDFWGGGGEGERGLNGLGGIARIFWKVCFQSRMIVNE